MLSVATGAACIRASARGIARLSVVHHRRACPVDASDHANLGRKRHWSTKASVVYTELLEAGAALAPGWSSDMHAIADGSTFCFYAELRRNAVWRRGRVFLRCPSCRSRRTRLYVPTSDVWLLCRCCWGLSYSSRRNNYRDTAPNRRWLGPWALTHRIKTALQTGRRRKDRATFALERYARRRPRLFPNLQSI